MPDNREEVLAYLSRVLSLEVARWTRSWERWPIHELHLRSGIVIDVAVGGVGPATSGKRFQNAVYQYTGIWVGPFKTDDWLRIFRALDSILEDVPHAR